MHLLQQESTTDNHDLNNLGRVKTKFKSQENNLRHISFSLEPLNPGILET
jgi:hypothetical protein